MKKIYINPEIKLSVFESENVITGSGNTTNTTAAEYISKNRSQIWGDQADTFRDVITF